ncbi:MAG: tryptophan synthase subunit alpha [Oscillospiraceae bacterium]|jgi:tryptophan synthase alpha chain|nr:tryptophan synthase subunit alpha [Oscillospiraceae bacterium]
MSKFVSFITAGDPSLAKTKEFIGILSEHSDFVEIGLPFSDPIAEGEVIQQASERALRNGVTPAQVFDMLQTLDPARRGKLVILTYANTAFSYGYSRFFGRCADCGVFGAVIPDIPYEERGEAAGYAAQHGVHLITMIAPTSAGRIQTLAKEAGGFIYLVSSMGVTGVRSEFSDDLPGIVAQIREVTDVPVMVGFGISTPEQVKAVGAFADGAIVGSAFVRIIAEHGADSAPHLKKFIKELTGNGPVPIG